MEFVLYFVGTILATSSLATQGSLEEVIFSDGFESGDSTEWSETVGLACDPCLPAVGAAIQWDAATGYLFRGNEYIQVDSTQTVLSASPLSLVDGWDGWPSSWNGECDAAFYDLNGKVYFFRENEYLRYDAVLDSVDPGYPYAIASGWEGWPSTWANGIDAALMGANNKVFFFRDGEYLRYDLVNDAVDYGYPKTINANWTGWPASWVDGVDAAINWSDDTALLFSGESYLSYDLILDSVDPGFPKPIAPNFSGWPESWSQEQ